MAIAVAVPLHALSAQPEPAPRTLGTPASTIEGEFSALHSVHELPDGRLLISDSRDPTIRIYGPASRTFATLGRTGEGPGEYRQPGGFYPGLADTVFLVDRGQPRLLVIDPHGRIADTRTFAFPGGGRSISTGVRDRHQVDAHGRVYVSELFFPQQAFPAAPAARSDSLSLLRFDPARSSTDTVVRLRQAEATTVGGDGFRVTVQTVFSPADGWWVTPDGWVAVARAAPYRVDWVDPSGRVHRGPETPHDRIPVTEADREATRRERARLQGGIVGGTRIRRPDGSSVEMPAVPEPKFAEFKPPFGDAEVRASADRHVWIRRHQPAGSTRVVYDVFDRTGARIDRIQLPDRSRLVGVSQRSLFVSEPDEDDVPRLLRYAR